MFASITSWIMNGKYDGIIHPGAFLPVWRWHSPEAKGWSQRHCLGWLALIFPHHTSVDTETFLQERFRFSRWKFTLKSGTLLGVAGADVSLAHFSVTLPPTPHLFSEKKVCSFNQTFRLRFRWNFTLEPETLPLLHTKVHAPRCKTVSYVTPLSHTTYHPNECIARGCCWCCYTLKHLAKLTPTVSHCTHGHTAQSFTSLNTLNTCTLVASKYTQSVQFDVPIEVKIYIGVNRA